MNGCTGSPRIAYEVVVSGVSVDIAWPFAIWSLWDYNAEGPVRATTIANVEMARLWDGPEGDDWTDNAERYESTGRWNWARFERDVPVLATDDVLDVGCGTGRSTLLTARRAAEGTVVGVDLSSRMLAYAHERAAATGITNVTFLKADAQVEPFAPASRDLVISSYGAMFFADPVAAFANLGVALRPGGRLAVATWRRFEENEWLSTIRRIAAQDRDLPIRLRGCLDRSGSPILTRSRRSSTPPATATSTSRRATNRCSSARTPTRRGRS